MRAHPPTHAYTHTACRAGLFTPISIGRGSDINLIQYGVSEKVGTGLQHLSTFLAGFVIGFVKNWKLALVILSVVPLMAIVGAVFGRLPLIGRLFQGPAMGIGLLTAGIILAIMIIPFIASVMRDVFEVTPAMLKESAYGLGSTTWEVVWNIVLPYTKAGVIGGVMLGLGRALGETMAVTFVIGNTNALDTISLFAPGNSIPSALANEFAEAGSGLHTSALIELGLVLFLITLAVLVFSKLLLLRLARQEGTKT